MNEKKSADLEKLGRENEDWKFRFESLTRRPVSVESEREGGRERPIGSGSIR